MKKYIQLELEIQILNEEIVRTSPETPDNVGWGEFGSGTPVNGWFKN